jgi:catechol 2,3-dioxygenase-like lactoylglutathione lyase family enzyme
VERLISKLVEDFVEGRTSRRQLIRNLALTLGATTIGPARASEGKVAKAIGINHISYQVADYAKTRDFYSSVFGMAVSDDNGKQCRLSVGESGIIPHNYPSNTPRVDHIAYTISNWDQDKEGLEAEFKRRGILTRGDVKTSLHIKDPDGFDVQVVGKNYVEKA